MQQQQVQGQMSISQNSMRQIPSQFSPPPGLQTSPQQNNFSSQQQIPPQVFIQSLNHGRQSFQTVPQQQVQFFAQRPLFPSFYNQPQTIQPQQQIGFIVQQRENTENQLNMMDALQRPESLDINHLKNKQEFMNFMETYADKDNYFCQICHNLLWQPVGCSNCSKIYCKDCLSPWLIQISTCPTCRERFELKKVDKSITNNLSKLVFTCNAIATGCSEFINYDSLYKHQNICGYQEIQCKNIGCEFKSIRKEMEPHNKTCPHYQSKCKWCERNIKRMNEQQHEEICEMKILGCENQGCTLSLTRAEMNKHILECPFNMVRCDMCNQDYKLKDIKHHQEKCEFKILQCRGCKQNMQKKQITQHEEICEEVELQCPSCTDVIQRKNLSQHDQIICLKRGQKILFDGKTQLSCENAKLRQDIETLKLCVAQLYENVQDLISERSDNTRTSIMKILKTQP